MHPIFKIVAIPPATRFVQAVGELGNLVVCRRRSIAGVLSHTPWAQVSGPTVVNTSGVRSDDISYLFHTSITYLVFPVTCLGGDTGSAKPACLWHSLVSACC